MRKEILETYIDAATPFYAFGNKFSNDVSVQVTRATEACAMLTSRRRITDDPQGTKFA